MHMTAFTFMKVNGKLFFAQHLSQAASGSRGARCERCQACGVDTGGLTGLGNQLAIAIDDENGFREGVAHQTITRVCERLLLLFENDHLSHALSSRGKARTYQDADVVCSAETSTAIRVSKTEDRGVRPPTFEWDRPDDAV
jgi:hypothetical protein